MDGALIIWGVVSGTFLYAFIAWALAPASPPSIEQLLMQLIRAILKELYNA